MPLAVTVFALAGGLAAPTPPPAPIVGGTEAATCEYPAAVAMMEDDDTPTLCTGSLVHPELVVTASHCIMPERPIVAVGFGETGLVDPAPTRTVAVVECVGHPNFEQWGVSDVGYCVLAEPVTDVPRVPILQGCEMDELDVGDEVTIVGFGATWGEVLEGGEKNVVGVGTKRFVQQTVYEIDEDEQYVYLVGETGSDSACFGDSGGPALLQLPDGSWRVFGAASQLFDPGGFPDPMEPGNYCGVGTSYSYVSLLIDWLESESGFDLTPCLGPGGTWEAGCIAAPMEPGNAFGAWANGCAGGPMSDAPACGEVAGETGGESGSSDGGVDGSSDGGGSGGAGGGESTGVSGDGGGSTTGVVDPSVGDDAGSSDGGESSDGEAMEEKKGCGCASARGTGAPRLLLLVGLGAFRRRRARSLRR
jgi:hypothetical protein